MADWHVKSSTLPPRRLAHEEFSGYKETTLPPELPPPPELHPTVLARRCQNFSYPTGQLGGKVTALKSQPATS